MPRHSRQQLDEMARQRAGCVKLQYNRSTGTLIGIYKSKEAGIEDDPNCKWTTVCEDHTNSNESGGTVVCHSTRKLAEGHAADPLLWCEICQDKMKEKNNA